MLQDTESEIGTFLEVFPLEMVAGERQGALKRPDAILVSERISRKYFGAASALGWVLKEA